MFFFCIGMNVLKKIIFDLNTTTYLSSRITSSSEGQVRKRNKKLSFLVLNHFVLWVKYFMEQLSVILKNSGKS